MKLISQSRQDQDIFECTFYMIMARQPECRSEDLIPTYFDMLWFQLVTCEEFSE